MQAELLIERIKGLPLIRLPRWKISSSFCGGGR
jgi:hypothetical protein